MTAILCVLQPLHNNHKIQIKKKCNIDICGSQAKMEDPHACDRPYEYIVNQCHAAESVMSQNMGDLSLY